MQYFNGKPEGGFVFYGSMFMLYVSVASSVEVMGFYGILPWNLYPECKLPP